eukprot:13164179-Alexandrium_andersonii.AAC.1
MSAPTANMASTSSAATPISSSGQIRPTALLENSPCCSITAQRRPEQQRSACRTAAKWFVSSALAVAPSPALAAPVFVVVSTVGAMQWGSRPGCRRRRGPLLAFA